MTRLAFGAVLGLLVACPTLLAVVLAVVAAVVSQPAVLAFAAGVLLWPRLARRVRGWTR
jgi:ABC-type dipeptide/oligopeptide/nickel transport system permease subunit